jgi:hypothetical protein
VSIGLQWCAECVRSEIAGWFRLAMIHPSSALQKPRQAVSVMRAGKWFGGHATDDPT